MKLYLAGVTPSPQQNLDTFFFNAGIARLHSYDNRQEPDIWIYNMKVLAGNVWEGTYIHE